MSGNQDKERVLLTVAHQDDEVFIASRLKHHLDQGDDVVVVWTCLSYEEGDEYKETRIRESKAMMAFMGIPETNYHFWGYRGSDSHLDIGEILDDLRRLIGEMMPTTIYTLAYEAGNIDHDVIHFCTVKVARELVPEAKIFEFPLYNIVTGRKKPLLYRIIWRDYPDDLPTEVRVLPREAYKYVRKCWGFFKSQRLLIVPMALTVGRRGALGTEYVRPLPEYDYSESPPGYEIAYETYLPVTFADYREALIPFLSEK